jgi:V/A-type H+-transporting ATPase subunit D
MAKIKHTKNELKAQRESLERFERFLPMLQLKKQQLQAEMTAIDTLVAELTAEELELEGHLTKWIDLFSEQVDIAALISVKELRVKSSNIAGVNIPVFEEMTFTRQEVDLGLTPAWIDPGMDMLEKIAALRTRCRIMEEQKRLISEELRVTNQRVNLFEKVKIPECRENIREIRIFLGDEQTASVTRAKIAKGRTDDYQYKDEAA